MIVKNESKIITRLFDSVYSILDSYFICDTGSTDNTVSLIEEYFRTKNIPGKVVVDPFVNFCHNRSRALQECAHMSDFALLMDADMVLEIGPNFDKERILLSADNFNILQGGSSLQYQNLRIVRNDGKSCYIGVTHEYIQTAPNSRTVSLPKDVLFIADIGDGGSKSDKFERDIRLLTKGLEDEPKNVRYMFYLANSYFDSRKFEDAIHYYDMRIANGGWQQEVWYSYYRKGLAYFQLNKPAEAVWAFMEGYNYYPERIEGLYEVLKYYRVNAKYNLAHNIYALCKRILAQGHDRANYLFVRPDVYNYLVDYEYSIIAAYIGDRRISDTFVHLLNSNMPHHLLQNTLSNLQYYDITHKPDLFEKSYDNTFMDPELGITMTSSSCSLTPSNGLDREKGIGYVMNIRYVNYSIKPDGSYIMHGEGEHKGRIITQNECVLLDADLNVVSRKLLPFKTEPRLYMGVEDVRVFLAKDQLYFMGTSYHANNKIGIAYGKYDDAFQKTDLTQSFANTSCEKNWSLFEYHGVNHVVYNWSPLTICSLKHERIEVVERRQMPSIYNVVRGSSCGFTYANEIWFVGHIVAHTSPRQYYNIISVFDLDMNLLRYSAPFKFSGQSIEFCLSITVEDDRVLFGYSSWDRTTRVGVYTKKNIDDLLIYAP